MSDVGKILIGGGIMAAIAAYLLRLRRTSAELETVVSAKIHSISFSGLTIRVDVQLKNPTKGTMAIKFPFVKLIYKGSTIGSSQAINKDITIPSYGEVMIDSILISIPVLGLLSVAGDLIKAITGSPEGIKIQIVTISTIDLGWKTIPYEKLDEVVIKQQN